MWVWFVLVFVSMAMSLFTFFDARYHFYKTDRFSNKIIYLLLMVVCLIFCWLKRQDWNNGIITYNLWATIFYSLYNICIFVILVYLLWTKYEA